MVLVVDFDKDWNKLKQVICEWGQVMIRMYPESPDIPDKVKSFVGEGEWSQEQWQVITAALLTFPSSITFSDPI